MRGYLSEVYLPALVSAQAGQLLRRLGGRATVDDPMFGRASGIPALTRQLDEAAAWLTARSATFAPVAFTPGADRDVTEGTLEVAADGRRLSVPIAVVVERRAEREVEVRLYYATRGLSASPAARADLVAADDELALPPSVTAHLQALARGDVGGVVASFEDGGTLRDASGQGHRKIGDGSALGSYYEMLFQSRSVRRPGIDDLPTARPTGIQILKGGRADDGRHCALEYSANRPRGDRVVREPGLFVYERGDSGLLRALRIYEEL